MLAPVHGKSTVVIVDGDDLSQFTKTSQYEGEGAEHNTSTYGVDDETVSGGLRKHSFSMSGLYDSTAGTGPRAVLKPLLATVVPIVRRPEGTGAGKPQDSFNALIKKYVETNPVDDMVTWSCEMTVSGPVTSTTQ